MICVKHLPVQVVDKYLYFRAELMKSPLVKDVALHSKTLPMKLWISSSTKLQGLVLKQKTNFYMFTLRPTIYSVFIKYRSSQDLTFLNTQEMIHYPIHIYLMNLP